MPELTRIENELLSVTVAALGAEMQSVRSSDGREWLWNGDPAFWAGRSPILFPIVGKAPDNRVMIDGTAYEMNQHGFARRSLFSLVDSATDSCRFALRASTETKAIYPFDFVLSLTHALSGPTLTVTTEIENTGDRPLPFGIGFHPAFVWPLPGAEGQPHNISLDNGGAPALSRLEGGLRKPGLLASPFEAGRLELDHRFFEDDAMIFPEGAGDGLRYGTDGGPTLKFTFENLPNLALWTKPGAPFICIEPWHGTAPASGEGAEIEARPYGTTLLPKARTSFGFSVEFPLY